VKPQVRMFSAALSYRAIPPPSTFSRQLLLNLDRVQKA
jgi:hypothetical protein